MEWRVSEWLYEMIRGSVVADCVKSKQFHHHIRVRHPSSPESTQQTLSSSFSDEMLESTQPTLSSSSSFLDEVLQLTSHKDRSSVSLVCKSWYHAEQ
ncbi:hypothetical protein Q3G72_030000 [Acer saccharum]|nr:hypothetical protein Q3G72_030000 [Acer saccharum]